MNRKSKGNKKENEVKAIHEARGYTVERVRNVPFHHGDLLGCADLICSNKKHMKLIAVTSRANRARARKALKSFTNHPPWVVKEVWYYSKGNKNAWGIEDV